MTTRADKSQQPRQNSAAHETAEPQSGVQKTLQFADNRPDAVAQRQVQTLANQSPLIQRSAETQAAIHNSPHMAAQQERSQSLFGSSAPIGAQGGAVAPGLHQAISRARGGGRRLDGSIVGRMGGALGADFSRVRVHTDARADQLNRSLSARAFTLGNDLFFSKGAYNPYTPGGRRLLAHELTHVAQQSGSAGTVQTKLTVGAVGDRYEQEADRVAEQMAQGTEMALPGDGPTGEPVQPQMAVSRVSGGAGAVIQRVFERRYVAADTKSKVAEIKKGSNSLSLGKTMRSYSKGDIVTIDTDKAPILEGISREDLGEVGKNIGRNNIWVKVVNYKNTEPEYIRETELSMYLPDLHDPKPSKTVTSPVPPPAQNQDMELAKGVIANLLRVGEYGFKSHGTRHTGKRPEVEIRDLGDIKIENEEKKITPESQPTAKLLGGVAIVPPVEEGPQEKTINKGFLTEQEVNAINWLSRTPEGRKFLKDRGFLTQQETERWATDPKIADLWERFQQHDWDVRNLIPNVKGKDVLSPTHRLQIATLQRDLGLKGPDKFKRTPGYIRHQANLLKHPDEGVRAEARAEVYRQDTVAWKKTLMLDSTKRIEGDPTGTWTQRTENAIQILQRVFIILHDGMLYREKQTDELKEKWAENVAVALSHGGRVMIKLPPLISDQEDKHAFISWLLGNDSGEKEGNSSVHPEKTQKKDTEYKRAGVDTRAASSHGIEIDEKGRFEEVKANTLTLGIGQNVHMGEGLTLRKSATHFGMDLPLGGLGEIDLAGNVILPDGRHGHLYIYYDPPTLKTPGGVLIGVETSRMAETDVFGQYHDKRGAPAEFSSVGTAKSARIGDEFGGRVVDYTKIETDKDTPPKLVARDKDWLAQLKDTEKEVLEQMEKDKEKMINKLIGAPQGNRLRHLYPEIRPRAKGGLPPERLVTRGRSNAAPPPVTHLPPASTQTQTQTSTPPPKTRRRANTF